MDHFCPQHNSNMENPKSKRRSSKTYKTRKDDRAHTGMYRNSNGNPHGSFLSESSLVITSPQILPHIGRPNGLYASHQSAPGDPSRRPPGPQNYPRNPPPSNFPAQDANYTFGRNISPEGYRSQDGFPPPTQPWSSTYPGFYPPPDSNTRPLPPRKTSQIAAVGELVISNGQFSILTDDPPANGDDAIVRGARKVEITGGQFAIGNSRHVSSLFQETAHVAERAFRRDDPRPEEDVHEPQLC